jgi:outer membrane protein OmpA-like peptidoglycan-associated protein
MVNRESHSRRRGTGATTGRLVMAALLIGLGGCNPIETYRHWTGISQNDPNPETTPNTKNLVAAEAKGYPNLATVPPPPSQALTTAELNKLTQSLISDRANARYSSEHLQAQFDEAAAPPPPPPPRPPPAPAVSAAKPAAPAAPGTTPSTTAPSGTAPGSAQTVAVPPGAGAGTAPSAAAGPAAKGTRKSGQPPQPGPMESSLQSPQIASLPQPQQNQSAPPPPRELSMPTAPANAMGPAAHLPAPPAPAPMPAAIGSAKFEPAPPPPNLPSPAPVRTATATGPGKVAKPLPPTVAFARVSDIAFPGDATTLSDTDRQALGKIATRYQAKPGLVRIIGYAGVGNSAEQQLDSYRTALERAHAVADGLTKAGIPANKIQVEAAPTGSAPGRGRAEILLER